MAGKPSKKRPILVVPFNDTHCGSSVGLAVVERVPLDDGTWWLRSAAQEWMADQWSDYWRHVEDQRREAGALLHVVGVGDLVDGDHHGTSQIASRNPKAQGFLASCMVDSIRKLKPAKFYVVRGTEAHVGKSGSSEEDIAQRVGADPDPATGESSTWHLRLMVYNKLLDFQHHGRAGLRPWTHQNALNLLAAHIWMECGLNGERPPDVAFRAHRHVVGDSEHAYPTRVIALAPWQFKTGYGHKVAAESISKIGGTTCLIEPNGAEPLIRHHHYKVPLPPIREVA